MKRQFDPDWADAACGPLTLRTARTGAEIQFLRDALQRSTTLGGARDVMACWRKGGPLSQEQPRAIGLIRRDKSGRLFSPCYSAFNDLLAAPPGHVAFAPVHFAPLDSLCHQATGAPVAMAVHQGAKADCEIPVARGLLESVQPSRDNAVEQIFERYTLSRSAPQPLSNSEIRNSKFEIISPPTK